jgi:hypothetical protein
MPWTLYDYRDRRGRNPVLEWCLRLQKPDLARMNFKMDVLAEKGKDLCPNFLAGPLRGSPHLYKIRINGKVAPRLLLCKGPINMETEYTFLLGEFERDDELPEGMLETAEAYRQEIIANPNERRRPHERAKR